MKRDADVADYIARATNKADVSLVSAPSGTLTDAGVVERLSPQ